MEQISVILQPYKEIIGKVASAITFLQMLSGAAVCNNVRKQGSIANVSFVPFIGGTVMGIISLRLGTIIGDRNIIQTHGGGLIINFIYTAFLLFYATKSERNDFWRQSRIGFAFTATLLIYSFLEDSAIIEFRLNMILTIFLMILIASPLMYVPEIIRTKDSAKLQFPMIASGCMVGSMWFLYGLCLNNVGMVTQTSILLTLSFFQLALCFIYPAKSIVKDKRI